MNKLPQQRYLMTIASEIMVSDWMRLNQGDSCHARPYAEAMMALYTMDGEYGLDDADDIVLRFLSNAGTWRGETARRIKKELNDMYKTWNKKRRG